MKKNKYLQVFNYLLAFSQLRSKPIRDIETSDSFYPEVIWLSDIPKINIFDCITFPDFNHEVEYLLKISKPFNVPQRPLFPAIQRSFREYVVEESLLGTEGNPCLKEDFIVDEKEIEKSVKDSIIRDFDNYIVNQWKVDSLFYQKELNSYKIRECKMNSVRTIY